MGQKKWQNIFYVRGAKADKSRSANTMENIEALFKIANKNNDERILSSSTHLSNDSAK